MAQSLMHCKGAAGTVLTRRGCRATTPPASCGRPSASMWAAGSGRRFVPCRVRLRVLHGGGGREGVRGGSGKHRGASMCQASGRLVARQCTAVVLRPQSICLPCCYISSRVCPVDLCLGSGVAAIQVPRPSGRAGARRCREEYMTPRCQRARRQVGSDSATSVLFTIRRCLP